jgi:hypothetical protein
LSLFQDSRGHNISSFPNTLLVTKLLQENKGETLEDIGIGSDFLNITPTVQEIIATIINGIHQIRSFLHSK